jgi:hypothetical protein
VEMKVLFPEPVTPMTAMYMSSILPRRLVNNQETSCFDSYKMKNRCAYGSAASWFWFCFPLFWWPLFWFPLY